MTATYFNTLAPTEQYDLIMKEGVYLMERFDYNVTCTLFQHGSIYVEFHFSIEPKKLFYIYAFEDEQYLEPYLKKVNISPLQQILSS